MVLLKFGRKAPLTKLRSPKPEPEPEGRTVTVCSRLRGLNRLERAAGSNSSWTRITRLLVCCEQTEGQEEVFTSELDFLKSSSETVLQGAVDDGPDDTPASSLYCHLFVWFNIIL